MFLGESTPQQIIDFVTTVTAPSASCTRVISDRLSLEAQTRHYFLSQEQSSALMKLITDKLASCGVTTESPTNGTTPTPTGETCKGTFICSIPDMYLYVGAALLAFTMMKR
jgi:hypothetical protein